MASRIGRPPGGGRKTAKSLSLRSDLVAWAEERQRERGLASLTAYIDWSLEQMRFIQDELGQDFTKRLVQNAERGGQSFGGRVGSIVREVLRRER